MIAETEVIPERNLYIEPEPVVVYPTPAALGELPLYTLDQFDVFGRISVQTCITVKPLVTSTEAWSLADDDDDDPAAHS
jgi:hypothetical protein